MIGDNKRNLLIGILSDTHLRSQGESDVVFHLPNQRHTVFVLLSLEPVPSQ